MSECPQYIIPPKTLDMEHKLSACNYFLFFTSFHGTFSKNASIIFRRNSELINGAPHATIMSGQTRKKI